MLRKRKKARVQVEVIEVFKDQPNQQQLQEPHQVFVDDIDLWRQLISQEV